MSTRRVTTGVTVAVLAASLTACGSAADPIRDGESAAARARPAASTNPLAAAGARIAALRRPRTAEDRWPAYSTDNRPEDALIVDRGAARRLYAAGSPPYGLWLAPGGRRVEGDTASTPTPDVCLRVIPLSGPDRGGGTSSCASPDTVARNGKLVTILIGSAEARRMVVAGTVPDGVRSVRLVDVRTGVAERRPVHDNAFLFETNRSAKRLQYRGPDGPVTHPIDF